MTRKPTITVIVKGSAKGAQRAAARRGISLTKCKDAALSYGEHTADRVSCQAPCRDEQKLYDWENRVKLDTPIIKGRGRKAPGDIVGIIANRCRRFKPPYGVSNLARSFAGRRHGLRGPAGTVKAHKIRRGMRLWVEGAVREVASTARAYGPSGGARGKHWVDVAFVGGGGGMRVHGSSNVAVDDSNTVPYGPGW